MIRENATFDLIGEVELHTEPTPTTLLAAIQYGRQFKHLVEETGATESIRLDPISAETKRSKYWGDRVLKHLVSSETPTFNAKRLTGDLWQVTSRLQDVHTTGMAVINRLEGIVGIGYDAPVLQTISYLGRLFYRTDDIPYSYNQYKINKRQTAVTAAIHGLAYNIQDLRTHREYLDDAMVVE